MTRVLAATSSLYSPAMVRLEASVAPVAYAEAVERMEREVAAISAGEARELVWFLEHPPLYTAGTSARPGDLLWPNRFPVFSSGRGGQYTYHGPGQRIVYVMLDLRQRGQDVRAFVAALEQWLIAALASLRVAGERREDRVGVWVRRAGDEAKIAAIGVRIKRWVSLHGISLNVAPDLSHFDGIVPCGITSYGVTSLEDLGVKIGMIGVDKALIQSFASVFGPLDNNSKM